MFDNIFVLRLLSGEILIGMQEEEAGCTIYKKCYGVRITPQSNGMRVDLYAPFFPLSDQPITIENLESIAYKEVAKKDLADSYRSTVSGIIIAQENTLNNIPPSVIDINKRKK